MRKLSSHPRAKSHMMPRGMMDGRRFSIVEEMQQHAYETDSNVDLGTPNSQNMTDTDPPSKPFIKLTKSRMGDIPEDSELDPSGDDDDFKRWSEHQNSKEVSEGLLNEITGMKSEVRQEIEAMGGKMNQLEQNISTILSLLRERGLKSPETSFETTLKTPDHPRNSSRTASILSRVKAEMPEDILPDWVEMENFGMAGDAQNEEAAKSEAEKENVEEEAKTKKIGGRLTKKRKLDAKRKKKKAEKSLSKHNSEDENEDLEVHQDTVLDQPPTEAIEMPAEPVTPEMPQPTEEKPKTKQKKKRGKKSHKNKDEDPTSSSPQEDSAKAAVVLEMGEVSHQDPQGDENNSPEPEKLDSPRPESPAKDTEENEPENEPELNDEQEPENDGEKSEQFEAPDDGRASRQSQAAQPDDPQNPEAPESGRSDSPVSDGDKQPSRASTARKSSARSQHALESLPEENTPPEEDSSTEETPPSEGNTSRVQSAKPEPEPESERKHESEPEQQDKEPSRESSPVRRSSQGGDVAVTIDDSDDDIPVMKKEKPAYVE